MVSWSLTIEITLELPHSKDKAVAAPHSLTTLSWCENILFCELGMWYPWYERHDPMTLRTLDFSHIIFKPNIKTLQLKNK